MFVKVYYIRNQKINSIRIKMASQFRDFVKGYICGLSEGNFSFQMIINYLAKDSWKFIATVDKAWFYLSDCGKERAIYYKKGW